MKKLFTLVTLMAAYIAAFAGGGTATFNLVNNPEFMGWNNSYTNHTLDFTEATITINGNKQSSTITDMPVTKGQPVTVTMKEGYRPMTSAKITCKQWTNKAQTITAAASSDGETFTDIEGASSSDFTLDLTTLPEGTVAVKFIFSSTSNQVGIQEIEVAYEQAANFVPAPICDPKAGAVAEGTEVTLSCEAEGAEIYYTTDGTDPTKASTKYTAPIVIDYDVNLIKAIAYVGDDASAITEAQYTIIPAIESLGMLFDLIENEVDEFIMGCPLIVIYVNGAYNYVTDGYMNYGLIYKYDTGLAAGDMINPGWKCGIKVFKGLPELIPAQALDAEPSGQIVSPIPGDADMAPWLVSDMFVNGYFMLQKVLVPTAVTAETKEFVGYMGEGEDAFEVNFYNQFKIDTVSENEDQGGIELMDEGEGEDEPVNSIAPGIYDIIGFTSIYDTKVQFLPIKFLAAAEDPKLYAVGEFNNWDPANPVEFTFDDANYMYYLDIDQEIDKLKISTAKGTWDEFNAGALTVTTPLENKTWNTDLAAGSADIVLPWKGVYEVKVNGDMTSIWVGTDTPEPALPEVDIYLRGVMNDWEATDEWKFSTEDHIIYTLDNVTIAAGVEFKVADAKWEEVNFGGVADMDLNTEYTLIVSNSNCSLKEGLAGGKVTFDLANKTIIFAGESGIADIEAAAANAVYYNLQGVRVNNPAKGAVVIRVQGDKAQKVIVK